MRLGNTESGVAFGSAMSERNFEALLIARAEHVALLPARPQIAFREADYFTLLLIHSKGRSQSFLVTG